jgi:hypothetical protein
MTCTSHRPLSLGLLLLTACGGDAPDGKGPDVTAPIVQLFAPADSEVVPVGTVTLRGSVVDPDSPLEDVRLRWGGDLPGLEGPSHPLGDGSFEATVEVAQTGVFGVILEATDPAGASDDLTRVFRLNAAPSAPVVALAPARTGEAVVAELTTVGTDDPVDEVSHRWSWSRDGAAAPEYTEATLPAGVAFRGEVWQVAVLATDSYLESAAATATVTIGNAPPRVASVALTGGTGGGTDARETDTLRCTPSGVTDAEDDSVTLALAWTVNGSALATTADTLDGSAFRKGDRVRCGVTPHDGTEAGATVWGEVRVVDTPPIATDVVVPATLRAGDTATCAWSFSDIDGDADASTVAWTIDGVAAGTGPSWAGPFVHGDVVRCTVTPHDGERAGSPVSASVTVSDTAPTLGGVTITPVAPVRGDTLTCAATGASDADGEPVSVSYRWSRGSTTLGTSATLSTGFSRGDIPTCTATPDDGTLTGTAVSGSVTIGNAPPTVTVSLTPTSPGTDDLLEASVTTADADGDTLSVTWAWSVEGRVCDEEGDTLDGAAWFARDDEVALTVSVSDGRTTASATARTTVANTPPTAPVAGFFDDVPVAGEDALWCTLDGESLDADEDPIDYTFAWTVDGAAWTGATATTAWAGDTIAPEDLEAGQVWVCTIVADDGTDTSDPSETWEAEVIP